MIPVFQDGQQQCRHVPYVVTAAVAHYGDRDSGHYSSWYRCPLPQAKGPADPANIRFMYQPQLDTNIHESGKVL